jgi:hypothetical protein
VITHGHIPHPASAIVGAVLGALGTAVNGASLLAVIDLTWAWQILGFGSGICITAINIWYYREVAAARAIMQIKKYEYESMGHAAGVADEKAAQAKLDNAQGWKPKGRATGSEHSIDRPAARPPDGSGG